MSYSRTLSLTFFLQLIALGAAGSWFAHLMNPDAVAYLSLAEQIARGNLPEAISGYWGPLLSWLVALGLPGPPSAPSAEHSLGIARLVMAGSAILFFWGCVWFFQQARLPDNWRKLGAATAASVAVPWSVAQISPDLILAGLVAFALGFLLRARPGRWVLNTCAAGWLWGIACLAKPAALPLMILIGGLWHAWRGKEKSFPALAGCLAFWLAGMAVVLPWVAVMTKHFGTLTFSTSARIAHAVAGPPDQERYHPTMRTIHKGGRITTWEDPSQMPYADWSPLQSPAYAWHQVKIVFANLGRTQAMLTTMFAGWPLLLAGLIGRACRRPWSPAAKPSPDPDFWRPARTLSLLCLGALSLIYLPNYLVWGDQRYFYPAFPALFVVGAWGITRWPPKLPAACVPLLTASMFLIPALILLTAILPPKLQAGELAHKLAARMARYEQATGVFGPIGGSAQQPGGRVGFYVAYLLRQPWVGDDPKASAEVWRQMDLAEFILVNDGEPLAAQLARHPDYQNITPQLFPSQAASFPIQVFQFNRHAPGR